MGREAEIHGVVALGSVSGAVSIDYSRGNLFTATLVGSATLSISNLKPGHQGWVLLTQDATGGRAVTWSGSISPTPYVQLAAASATMVALVGASASVISESSVETQDSYPSGTPQLIPSAGGRLSILSGTAATPTLPDASLWIGQTVVVYLDNLAAGVTVSAAAGDLINGAATYPIAGPYGWATFVSISASKIAAAPV